MEEILDIPPMDLKASAEQEVRKLQDMVKRLEKQNEILRHGSSQNGADPVKLSKRDSVELEEVTLINLNDSSDELEDSWLHESPVKPATPAQKSVNSQKWTKDLDADGLDDVRGNLFDKLDDVETQQDISKVRVLQNQPGKIPPLNAQTNSLFFQPTISGPKSTKRNSNSPGPVGQNINYDNNQLDSSAYGSMDEMDDMPQGPILRRSAVGKDSSTNSNLPQTTQLEEMDEEPQGPILRRSAISKNNPKNDSSVVSQSSDMDEDIQGPILRRSAVGKASPKNERQQPNKKISQSEITDDVPQGPVLRRSALPKDTRTSPPLNGSPNSQRQTVNTSPGSRMQARSRGRQLTDGEGVESGNLETSSQSSQDDFDADDTNDKGPVQKRSALVLPKPSSEGLSKQLWYSGPISQMNKQKSKADSAVARRSGSPSPDRRNKLQASPRSPGATSGLAVRRSAGSRGSMEDLLDTDDSAPVQRRSLPQVPTETVGVKSRAVKSDEAISNRSQLKPKTKIQNLQQPQGNVVARRSKLATPSSGSPKGVVARRKAPSPNPNDGNLNDSWKDGCY